MTKNQDHWSTVARTTPLSRSKNHPTDVRVTGLIVSGPVSSPDFTCLLFCMCKLFARPSFLGASGRFATPCFSGFLAPRRTCSRATASDGSRRSFASFLSAALLSLRSKGSLALASTPLHLANLSVRGLSFASPKAGPSCSCKLFDVCCFDETLIHPLVITRNPEYRYGGVTVVLIAERARLRADFCPILNLAMEYPKPTIDFVDDELVVRDDFFYFPELQMSDEEYLTHLRWCVRNDKKRLRTQKSEMRKRRRLYRKILRLIKWSTISTKKKPKPLPGLGLELCVVGLLALTGVANLLV